MMVGSGCGPRRTHFPNRLGSHDCDAIAASFQLIVGVSPCQLSALCWCSSPHSRVVRPQGTVIARGARTRRQQVSARRRQSTAAAGCGDALAGIRCLRGLANAWNGTEAGVFQRARTYEEAIAGHGKAADAHEACQRAACEVRMRR